MTLRRLIRLHIGITLLILIAAVAGRSQEVVAEASVNTNGAKGFYKIRLTPEITPWLKQDCSNLRIVDSKGKQIQYMMEEEQRAYSSKFMMFPVVSQTSTPGCCTEIIFENTSGGSLNHFLIKIKNAEVVKEGTLHGSDDLKKMYVVKEDFLLSNIDNGTATSEIRSLNFPLTDYTYYKLTISDSTAPPLNILEIGYLKNIAIHESFTPIENVQITVSDSIKQTFLSFKFDTTQWVDRMYLVPAETPFYKRHATLYEIAATRNKSSTLKRQKRILHSFDISSGQPPVFDLKGETATEWLLVIENDDNPPLKFDSVAVLQINRHLIVFLDGTPPYTLRVGRYMEPPVYELAFFKNQVPDSLPVLDHGKVHPFNAIPEGSGHSDYFTSSLWVWGGIIAIIIILGWMSWGMIKETKARDTHL